MILSTAKLIVVKVGSALVTREDTGEADAPWLSDLAADVARLGSSGKRVLIVSSGAVALGRTRLRLAKTPMNLAAKQAAAATGQARLMRAWEEAFEPLGIACAQVLLTPQDTEVRRRFLNARATLGTLLDLGVIPVINENDTVATEELRYGDNDRLAARVAQMVGADVLVLLSDVDGLHTADPRRHPEARRISLVRRIDRSIETMAGGPNRARAAGAGGMATKLTAARIACAAGCATIIALGRRQRPLQFIELGGECTVFEPTTTPAAAYKSWIAASLRPQGSVVVDGGAAAALRAGRSLLSAGVRSVEGRFSKGDAVIVLDEAGAELGRGLARYDHDEAKLAAGRRSEAIAAELGYYPGPLIHANDLALSSARDERA
jgi:glutamate 5-kinase